MFVFLDALDNIGLSVLKAIRVVFLTACAFVYNLIVVFFNIFEKIGTAEILTNSTVRNMYNRVGLLIGIFMLFRVSFAFIQYVINPDAMLDNKKGAGNIVKRIVFVIVLLGVTPYLFREAYTLQNYLAKQNIIGRIIAPEMISSNSGDAGKNLAWFGFSSFFQLNTEEYQQYVEEQNVNYDEDALKNKCSVMIFSI